MIGCGGALIGCYRLKTGCWTSDGKCVLKSLRELIVNVELVVL